MYSIRLKTQKGQSLSYYSQAVFHSSEQEKIRDPLRYLSELWRQDRREAVTEIQFEQLSVVAHIVGFQENGEELQRNFLRDVYSGEYNYLFSKSLAIRINVKRARDGVGGLKEELEPITSILPACHATVVIDCSPAFINSLDCIEKIMMLRLESHLNRKRILLYSPTTEWKLKAVFQ